MRKAAIVLVILAILALGGDLVLGSVAEARLAEVAQDRLGLTHRPTVDLEGFPFFLYAVRRRFPAASLEVRDIRARGLTVDRFTLELRDVRLDSMASLTGGEGTITASRGRGTVEVTQESLGAYLERVGVPFRIEFVGSSRVRVSGTATALGKDVEASAEGELAVTEGSLEFRPERIEVGDGIRVPPSALAFRVDLPEVVPRLAYGGITLEGGRAILSFRIRGAVVPL